MIGASMDVSTIRELALQISGIDMIVALSPSSGTPAETSSGAEAPADDDGEIPSAQSAAL
ncbi:hypothetical protein [Sinomonas humi]|uniref:hypothetical protein n=1 Tax=Sinomonas humi TaxID=1338436 RepID=UPI0012E011AE|nr:hypothetical protein [Sinomonas humi]